MWRKIKGPVITICIMHLTALLCLIILSIVQCFVDMAEWISFALSMAVNIVVGLVFCNFLVFNVFTCFIFISFSFNDV